MSFADRSERMGLDVIGNGSYFYEDSLSKIRYDKLCTKEDPEIEVPVYAIFTGKPEPYEGRMTYVGVVSDEYEFEGNEIINDRIRQSILEFGSPVFREVTFLNPSLTYMRKEMVIQNSRVIHRTVGEIYPEIIISNTYNGHGAKNIQFGISMVHRDRTLSFGFKEKILSMRQVHIQSARSTVTSIGNYVESFSSGISDLIHTNMNNELSSMDIMRTLDLIEKIGKKRRDLISVELEAARAEGSIITTWNMFLSILKYSTMETNINAKSLLENVAERVLVLPGSMLTRLVEAA